MSEQYEVPRLLDGNDPQQAELREALRVASQDAPSALQVEQMTEGVLGTLAAGAGAGAGAGISSGALKWIALKSSWAKLAVVFFTMGGAAWVTGRSLPQDDGSGRAAVPAEQALPEVAGAPTTTPDERPDQVGEDVPEADDGSEPSAAQRADFLRHGGDLATDEVAAAHDERSPSVARTRGGARSRRGMRRRSLHRTRAGMAGSRSTASSSSEPHASSAPAAAQVAPVREPEKDTPAPESPADGATSQELVELELVGQAQRAFAQKPATALALLEKHRRKYPESHYAQERDALILDALARLGRTGELRSQATSFLARYPRSPHRERVRELLRQADQSAP